MLNLTQLPVDCLRVVFQFSRGLNTDRYLGLTNKLFARIVSKRVRDNREIAHLLLADPRVHYELEVMDSRGSVPYCIYQAVKADWADFAEPHVVESDIRGAYMAIAFLTAIRPSTRHAHGSRLYWQLATLLISTAMRFGMVDGTSITSKSLSGLHCAPLSIALPNADLALGIPKWRHVSCRSAGAQVYRDNPYIRFPEMIILRDADSYLLLFPDGSIFPSTNILGRDLRNVEKCDLFASLRQTQHDCPCASGRPIPLGNIVCSLCQPHLANTSYRIAVHLQRLAKAKRVQEDAHAQFVVDCNEFKAMSQMN